jgi:hypothetical protein
MNLIYILAIALLISLSSGLDLSISGNAAGTGYNETTIICPDCNISMNATSWFAESPTHDIFG